MKVPPTSLRVARLGVLAAALLAWAAPAHAASTALERFEKRVGKSAVEDPTAGSQPTTCICKDGAYQNRAGVLARSRAIAGTVTIQIQCDVLLFDQQTGAVSGVDGCFNWVLLPK